MALGRDFAAKNESIMTGNKKIIFFQYLRCIGFLLIFFSHCQGMLMIGGHSGLARWGGAGVTIFITLSGFLTALKFQQTDKSAKAFEEYKSKWEKFGWLHIITLIISVPWTIGLLRDSIVKWLGIFVTNLSLMQAFVPVESVYYSFNWVSWYLSVALFFAIMTPISIKIWKKLSLGSAVILIISVNILQYLLCLAFRESQISTWIIYICPLSRYLDYLISGGVHFSIGVNSTAENRQNCGAERMLCQRCSGAAATGYFNF